MKTIQREAGIKKFDFQKSFNRNLIFLHCKNEIIKTEFTFYQNPRARDFIDLFRIVKKKKWTLRNLIGKARIKFDWHIDHLQLGSQFLKAPEVKDYPKMIIKIKDADWQNFFIAEAEKFKKIF